MTTEEKIARVREAIHGYASICNLIFSKHEGVRMDFQPAPGQPELYVWFVEPDRDSFTTDKGYRNFTISAGISAEELARMDENKLLNQVKMNWIVMMNTLWLGALSECGLLDKNREIMKAKFEE